jgi:hypothetical protein
MMMAWQLGTAAEEYIGECPESMNHFSPRLGLFQSQE